MNRKLINFFTISFFTLILLFLIDKNFNIFNYETGSRSDRFSKIKSRHIHILSENSNIEIVSKSNVINGINIPIVNVKRSITLNKSLNSIDLKTNLPIQSGISWDSFASSEFQLNSVKFPHQSLEPFQFKPYKICSSSTEELMTSPHLSKSDQDWCTWALSPTGGKVQVGITWGTLENNREYRDKYEDFNCNAYAKGLNPSCDDDWGDSHLLRWTKNEVDSVKCGTDRKSKFVCYESDDKAKFCYIENVMVDFSKMKDQPRGADQTMSRGFDKGFLSIDCSNDDNKGEYFTWNRMLSTNKANIKSSSLSKPCDYLLNGTTIVYSHDDIRNVGHTINDIMNVWMMMWLSGISRYSESMSLLNIDSFNNGHNFHDDPKFSPFYLTYQKTFSHMLAGAAFKGKTVCLQRAIFQPHDRKAFVWDSWFKDSSCSLLGPSPLFQRWNLAVRSQYGLLKTEELDENVSKEIRILIINRKAYTNRWGNERTSRNFINIDEIVNKLQENVKFPAEIYTKYPLLTIKVLAVSLEQYSFEEQITLISTATMLIGTHGAGLALGMHMSIGHLFCCGVLEIFPTGEFKPIRGHGNMFRRMGIKYHRLDISAADSHSDGVVVRSDNIVSLVNMQLSNMVTDPSCIRDKAYSDPYFDQAKKILSVI
jgi:hypothetical protein